MPKKVHDPLIRTNELLEKLLALQMYMAGMPKGDIARMIGRSKETVVAMLKGLPKKGA